MIWHRRRFFERVVLLAKENKKREILKNSIKDKFVSTAHIMWGRDLDELTKQEIYQTIAATLKEFITKNWIKTNKAYMERQVKQVYYFSVEFLLGRLLDSNLVNLGLRDVFSDALSELGIDLKLEEEEEPDAGLGNGGLGRLAACFIDSMASLGLPGHGCSIRYKYGLFEQKIVDGHQAEIPDNWLKNGFIWEYRKPDKAVEVRFGGNAYMREKDDGSGDLELVREGYTTIMGVPYDVPIVGYHNNTVNTLRLWNAEVDEDFSEFATMTQEQIHEHMKYRDVVSHITDWLYPNDSTWEGRRTRLIQEYFFVSAGTQSIIRHYKRAGMDLHDLGNKIAIHINDTHPALVVAELMRILVDVEGFEWEEAADITRSVVGYTNHTILPEALETWPVDMLKPLIPRIYMIIDEINRRHLINVRERYPENEQMVRELSIIQDGNVHMARLAVVGSHSVNGVAKIHSNILKTTTMKYFNEYYPGKFNNKTNGITHRRWLIGSNPELAKLIDDTIGGKWHRKPENLILLNNFVDDRPFLDNLRKVKQIRKEALANFIERKQGIKVDPKSMFDIQVKRIHSYKRQLMNIMHIMWQYDHIKTDSMYHMTPTTYFFGGKAAPGYFIAKETIRLINAVADKVNNDPDVNKYMRVVFIENFGVSIGEMTYPAADVSEQISTASKEASGTGCMKFMMNGAITLGTLDGANVEICDAVGQENCVIFGLTAAEVLAYYATGAYSAWDQYQRDKDSKLVMDKLVDGTYGDFRSLYDYLLQSNDEFFILKDFGAYDRARVQVYKMYKDPYRWLSASAINIANSGKFSSDRTISEYARDIWDLKPIVIS